jgi:hypothetical protein
MFGDGRVGSGGFALERPSKTKVQVVEHALWRRRAQKLECAIVERYEPEVTATLHTPDLAQFVECTQHRRSGRGGAERFTDDALLDVPGCDGQQACGLERLGRQLLKEGTPRQICINS